MTINRPSPHSDEHPEPMKLEYKTLGEVFRAAMQRGKYKTYQDFGDDIGLSDVTIGRLCKDVQETLDVNHLYRFARHFKIPVAPLLLLNSINQLPPRVRSQVYIDKGLFDLLGGSDISGDLSLLPVFSEIQLPLSVWNRDRKKGHSAAQILAEHAMEESGEQDLSGKHLRGDKFLFHFNGAHMLSLSQSAKIVPSGAYLLIQEIEWSELKNGELVLVQLLPVGKQKHTESATIYAYKRREVNRNIWESFYPSNTENFPIRTRHTGKFGAQGERELSETRIIYGKVVRIVDLRY
jgi:hypothetical protein